MGAAEFSQYQDGTDMAQAFRDAREVAEDENGGRNGNIAAKDEAVILHSHPVTLDEAHKLAEGYQHRNAKGTDDKWGPAGAIAVRGGERRVLVTITPKEGGYLTTQQAAEASLQAQGLLREGERMTHEVQGMYSINRRRHIVAGDLDVTIEGGTGPEQTGWLFFGTADN